ncbi:metallophosphoesterase [Neobacillus niacini]|uniref:metallophosphoesterase n=1 Tax=Neobacillus niacini TaxID=86668 RepID=UPI003002CE2E
MVYIIVLLLFGGAGLILYMLKEAFLNRLVLHEMTFEDFPSSFGEVSIFFISDIHKRLISNDIVDKVKGKADIVIIGGDLTERKVPFERVKENLEKLKQLGPVYFVWGNNDYETDYHKLDAILLSYGVKILDNTAAIFESANGDKLSLLGVDALNQGRDRLDLALLDAGDDSFKVLVSHYPTITKKIVPEHDIRLVLSGHTHGGQIHIFGYSPYEKGKVEKLENTTLLISNGYGTTGVPLRLGAPAECHLITIKHG